MLYNTFAIIVGIIGLAATLIFAHESRSSDRWLRQPHHRAARYDPFDPLHHRRQFHENRRRDARLMAWTALSATVFLVAICYVVA